MDREKLNVDLQAFHLRIMIAAPEGSWGVCVCGGEVLVYFCKGTAALEISSGSRSVQSDMIISV